MGIGSKIRDFTKGMNGYMITFVKIDDGVVSKQMFPVVLQKDEFKNIDKIIGIAVEALG